MRRPAMGPVLALAGVLLRPAGVVVLRPARRTVPIDGGTHGHGHDHADPVPGRPPEPEEAPAGEDL
jgi:hypothetical protein